MHKCFKCGTEFDGKFCPNCGSEWEENKICPKCGANLPGEARFCKECGYSFAGKTAENAIKPQSAMLQKVFSALRFLPFAALALFSVLLFAFFAAPVAELVMGAGFPNLSLGNVYSMQSGILSELPQLYGSLVSLIFFTVIAFLYSCAFGAVLFARELKFKSVKTAKYEISLALLLDYVSFIFYLIVIIIAATVMGMISSADGGMGILASGACPILLIVFSIVLALLAAGSLVARFLLAKKYPELTREEKMREERYIQAEKARKEHFYATHTAPVPPIMTGQPKKEYNRSAVIYRHDKRRYDKAKEGKTPAAVIWIDLHMAAVLSVVAILLVAIILISVLVPIFTNKFRVSVVEKINLGDNREQVIKILGEPNETLYNDTCWQYYSDEYASIQEKIAKNIEKQEQAIEKGDEKMLLRLADEELKLEEQLQTVKYDFIEIEFTVKNENELSVSSVFFEKNRCDSATESTKTVKKYSVLSETFSQNNKLPYRTYFTDGSYYSSYAQPAVKDISGNSVGLIWSDKFYSEYETYYTNFSGYLIINGVCYINSNRIEIPSEDKNKITSLIFMDDVTTIGERAFYGCTSLTSITIPDSVTSIGNSAFSGCSSLTSITIPDSVTSIGQYAFSGCTAEIKWGDNSSIKEIGQYAFSGYKGTSITIPDSVTEIVTETFKNCTSLESITIGNGVTSIGEYAFSGCTNIKTATMPTTAIKYIPKDNLQTVILTSGDTIGEDAFRSCTSLESVTIGNSVTSIGEDAFRSCTSLESVTIGNSVTSIGDYAFSYCTSLESVTIGNSVTSIGERAFYGCTSHESVYITDIAAWCNIDFGSYDANPLYYAHNLYLNNQLVTKLTAEMLQGATTIKKYAFEDCDNLTSITIPDSVTSIDYRAFEDCTNIKTATMPAFAIIYIPKDNLQSVTITSGNIGSSAFYNCTSLQSITMGSGITSISIQAFNGCTSLESITIPDSVTSIDHYAFDGCTSLESVYITDIAAWCNIDFARNYGGNYYANPLYYAHNLYLNNQLVTKLTAEMLQGVTTIKKYAFQGCTSLTSITIPDSVTSIGDGAFEDCENIKTATMPTIAIQYIPKDNLQTVILTSGDTIGSYAFEDCTSLESITIPDSVTSIGSGSFSRCMNLESITIPDSVTSIGEYAFNGCTAEIKWGDNPSIKKIEKNAFGGYKGTSITIPDSVTSIGDSAFYGCESLTNITIPDSVTSIGDSAFYGCESFTNITIPDSVTSIGDSAFYGCESLTNITIPDSVTSIGMSAFYYCRSLTNVTIGNSVTSIGYNAFNYCTSLTSITIPDSVTSIGSDAFFNCGIESVKFENPNGWSCFDEYYNNRVDIPSYDLQNPETAATYLEGTYRNYYWRRKTT